MRVTLSDTALRHIALFEDVTGASAVDCLVDDDRVCFLVATGEMSDAIGPDGTTVEQVEERLDKRVSLVENADTAELFVANALAPAVVHNVTISENASTVAYAEVDRADTGVAIGRDGETIETARRLAERQFDIDDIELA
ncbi:transcription elongation factor NusA-like protein [Halococcus morrhuae DSM 1307]|uniref:Probable transcription termination protein NusA n=2 Tax=Halococcus morrhuae TaxID=2250 RepID=NUSA_HALMO|nr:NusA-like transcription termination signal-binding factor [Halococcus morrhuae]P15738.1 RecName: Full=Probable transcription termination protein NusA [Halococcus morrhuae]EMA48922.1 transcription elongation factor NusA-like protein [Halococcus morrhuae DSM 1307]CAA40433.1 ORF 139 [Halococcus morrhuae]